MVFFFFLISFPAAKLRDGMAINSTFMTTSFTPVWCGLTPAATEHHTAARALPNPTGGIGGVIVRKFVG